MKVINFHSKGGTCDRCGKGIVNVAIFEHDGEKMEVGLDCAIKLVSDDFPAAKAVKAEMKAVRELAAFKRAISKGHYFVRPVSDDSQNALLYWSDAKSSHYAGWTNETLNGVRAEYRDTILNYARSNKNCAV